MTVSEPPFLSFWPLAQVPIPPAAVHEVNASGCSVVHVTFKEALGLTVIGPSEPLILRSTFGVTCGDGDGEGLGDGDGDGDGCGLTPGDG